MLSPLFSSSLTLLFFFLSFEERHQRVFSPFSFSFSPHPSPPTFSQWQTERDLPTRHRRPTSECDFLSVEKRRETGCIPALRRQGGSDDANQPRCLFLPLPLSRYAFHDLDDLADIVSWAPGEVVGRRSGGRGRKELSPPLPLSSARTKKAIGRFFLSRQRGRLASFVALLSLLSPRL